jgi:hypothetical protein
VPWLWYCGVYSQNSEIYVNILKLCKTNITCNFACFPRTWRHLTHIIFPYLSKNFILVREYIFDKFYYFPKFSFSSHNVFLLWILQHVIASKSNHINTMLPNEMVLAPLKKLKIKYELSYQYNTRLKYIDKFDQLLIIHQWRSTVDNTVRSLTHFTIFIWYYVIELFPSFIKSSLNNWCPMKMFIVRDTDNNSSDYIT